MTNRVFLSILISVLAISIFNHEASAQFEQKFTFQAAGGYVKALEPDWFSDIFEDGFSLDAGAQYNFNRSTSMVMLVKYSKFFAVSGIANLSSVNYNLLGISLCPKLRMLPRYRINPYLFAGGSINYIKLVIPSIAMPTKVHIGFTGGIGVDIRVSDNFALFWQGGFNGIDQNDDLMTAIYSQAGINISLFKAKSL
jgi:opacity protein-like surface antigen